LPHRPNAALSALPAATTKPSLFPGDLKNEPFNHRNVHGSAIFNSLLESTVREYDRRIAELTAHSELARRLMTRPGVGKLTASAIVATGGEAREFRNGRQFAASLGLVPRQFSTGGKPRLGSITKRGDTYLRTLLILGARTVLRTAARHPDSRLHRWARELQVRRGWHKACVAVAAKTARIAWALLANGNSDGAAAGVA
jgi:transposase